MKKVILILTATIVLSALGCKKERWLRVYRAGVFQDSINVTGWEPNEDVVELGNFYYPWQGEDSIDYSGGDYFYEGKKFLGGYPSLTLSVNGSIVGFRIDCFQEIIDMYQAFDSSNIITIDYIDSWSDEHNYNLATLKRFPNLISVDIHIDARTEVIKLDSIPSHLRLFLCMYNAADDDIRKLSRYKNIRVLSIAGDSITEKGLKYILKLKDLRELSVSYPYYFKKRRWISLPKLRRLESNLIYLE